MLGNFAAAAAAPSQDIFEHNRQGSSSSGITRKLLHWYSNVYVVTLVIYGLWIVSGLLFYYFVDDWTWATSFFFALQGGLSVGFCAPVEHTDSSRLFTVFYILLGSSVVAGSLGQFAGQLLYGKVQCMCMCCIGLGLGLGIGVGIQCWYAAVLCCVVLALLWHCFIFLCVAYIALHCVALRCIA
jgi:hypothetical protein